MRPYYVVGFDCGDFFNTFGTSWTRYGAIKLAVEAEKEYGEKPLIKRIKQEENSNEKNHCSF